MIRCNTNYLYNAFDYDSDNVKQLYVKNVIGELKTMLSLDSSKYQLKVLSEKIY